MGRKLVGSLCLKNGLRMPYMIDVFEGYKLYQNFYD